MDTKEASGSKQPDTKTREEAVKFIKEGSHGRFFAVEFIKRTTGLVRVMNARYGVRKHLKGGERAYDFDAHGLVCVWDAKKREYRTISVEGILRIKIDGEWFAVVHPTEGNQHGRLVSLDINGS